MIYDRFLGCARPLHFVGESHCLPFRNVLFQPVSSGDIFFGRTRFLPIPASQFTDEGGSLHGDIDKALAAEQLMDAHGVPVHLAKNKLELRAAEISGIEPNIPTLVMFAGDIDISGVLLQLGNNFDFELPEDPGYGVNKNLAPIPFTTLNAQMAKLFRPFFVGCKKLKDIGFRRLMMHGLPPRIRDTHKQAWTGISADSQVRAKLAVLSNRILHSACMDLDVPFIDIWKNITDEGYLRPNFCLDGIHLNRAAALLSLGQIIEKLSPLP